MESSLLIRLVNPDPVIEGSVLLEQKGWSDTANLVTYLDVVNTISDTFYGTSDFDKDCVVVENSYESVVYAYPNPPSLALVGHGITRGTYNLVQVEIHDVVQNIQFKLTSEESTTYPVHALSSIEWLDKTYNSNGEEVAIPTLSTSGNTITSSRSVYGTAQLKYKSIRYVFGVNVVADTDAIENLFSSVFWCRWDGGAEMLELDPPENAEENAVYNVNDCRYKHLLTDVSGPDDPEPPTTSGSDEYIAIDYCSQAIRG